VTDPARDPRPERTPADIDDAERARALRTLVRRLLVGGIVFLAVVSLGLLPDVLSQVSPGLGRAATVAAWVLGPLAAVGFLVFAALRLRR
jgi:hypothetical protein